MLCTVKKTAGEKVHLLFSPFHRLDKNAKQTTVTLLLNLIPLHLYLLSLRCGGQLEVSKAL